MNICMHKTPEKFDSIKLAYDVNLMTFKFSKGQASFRMYLASLDLQMCAGR